MTFGLYRHFKGGLYLALGSLPLQDDAIPPRYFSHVVVYVALKKPWRIYFRTLTNWRERLLLTNRPYSPGIAAPTRFRKVWP